MIRRTYRKWRESRRYRDQALVLGILLFHNELSALQISKLSKLSVGKLYVILARMENADLITSRSDSSPYPRRRLYRIPQD